MLIADDLQTRVFDGGLLKFMMTMLQECTGPGLLAMTWVKIASLSAGLNHSFTATPCRRLPKVPMKTTTRLAISVFSGAVMARAAMRLAWH